MFGWIFGRKKQVEDIQEIKEGTKRGFDSVKHDLNSLGVWVKHLKEGDEKQDFRMNEIEERLSSIENDLDGIKNSFALFENNFSRRPFKQPQAIVHKQTSVQGVQEPVQTAVQTGGRAIFDGLSVMERAVIGVLVNTDMKLSYDDLAAMLGKSRATIRGQVNSIKQKNPGVIEEIIEANGKKRIFIPEELRETMLRSRKVKVNREK